MSDTDDARTRAAERLRDLAGEGYHVGLDQMQWALELEPDCEESDDEDVYEKLADLIDPTCEVESVETCWSELGQLEGWEFRLTCGHSLRRPYKEAPAYCPECGARVVSSNGASDR